MRSQAGPSDLDGGPYFARWRACDDLAGQSPPAMMPLMEQLWPICRSITGDGLRETLRILGESLSMVRRSVRSGTQCFDWIVPPEWNIRDAYVKDTSGRRVIDFKKSNLHVLGYSLPVHRRMALAELQEHLYSLPDQPDAIPYRTSYYTPAWGFCLAHAERERLEDGEYEVVIDSTLAPGRLDYGQVILNGASRRELLLSTYICHPSLANNELSGPVVLTTLLQCLARLPPGRFTYRGIFTPETIGTIAFLSEHHETVGERIAAGYVTTCVGDDGPFTYIRSKRGGTLADRAAEHALRFVAKGKPLSIRDYDPKGSDERQYCSPGINWPVGSLMRSRYGEYREYHTSKDDLTFVSEQGLGASLLAYFRILQTIEVNCRPVRTNPYCEPQLGRRGLYPTIASESLDDSFQELLTLLAFADGEHDLIAIGDKLQRPVWALLPAVEALVRADLIVLRD